MNLLDEIKADYDLCINSPSEYQRKVDSISDLFSLKGKRRLKWDYCPVRVFGKYPSAPFVMFGINPGISQKNSPLEDAEARKSWQHYQNLYLNFYGSFYHFWIKSPYYAALSHLVTGLSNDHQNKSRWELFDSYLTNLELIPYHSDGIGLPSRYSSLQLDYLTASFTNSLDFIMNFRPKLFLFNENPWYVFLIKHNVIKEYNKVQILNDLSLYFFELEGIPSVLFDKFFQLHYYGMTNYDRRVTIPKLIHEKFQNF